MKGLIQRVTHASVHVGDDEIAAISAGLLVFIGVEKMDDTVHASKLCQKLMAYRVFSDQQGRMNQSVMDSRGSLLLVPQFTLAANTRSGTRPGFSDAAPPEKARPLFDFMIAETRSALGSGRVAAGRFGADMKVSLVNDGPVTFLLEVPPGQ